MTTPQLLATLAGGAAAGALLTALTSLFTGWLSRRHDDRRWLLDKRLQAYVNYNAAVQGWHQAWLGLPAAISEDVVLPAAISEELTAALAVLGECRRQVLLLAPPDVRQRTEDVYAVTTTGVEALRHRELERAKATMTGLAASFESLQLVQRANVQGRRRSD